MSARALAALLALCAATALAGGQEAPVRLEGPAAAVLGETVVLRAARAGPGARITVTRDGAPVTSWTSARDAAGVLEVQLDTGFARPSARPPRPSPAWFEAPLARPSVPRVVDAAGVPEWARRDADSPEGDPGRSTVQRAWRLDVTVESDLGISRGAVVVLDVRPRVLVIDGRPRWEHRALMRSLLRDPGLDVQGLLLSADAEWRQPSSPGLPALRGWPTPDQLAAQDVVVLGDLHVDPDQLPLLTDERARALADFVAAGGGLYVMSGADGRALWLEPLAPLLPVELAGAGAPSTHEGRLHVAPTSAGRSIGALRLGGGRAASAEAWADLAPLFASAASVELREGSEPLLGLSGREADPWTALPPIVLASVRRGHGRVVWMGLDETWRWTDSVFDRLHRGLVRTLAVSSCLTADDDRRRRRFESWPRSLARRELDPGERLLEATRLAHKAGWRAADLAVALQRAMPELYDADIAAISSRAAARGRVHLAHRDLGRPASARERLAREVDSIGVRLERALDELRAQRRLGDEGLRAVDRAAAGLELSGRGVRLTEALERGEGLRALDLARGWSRRIDVLLAVIDAATAGPPKPGGEARTSKRLARLAREHGPGRWLDGQRADEARALARILRLVSGEEATRARAALVEAFAYDLMATVHEGHPTGRAELHAVAHDCLIEAAGALRR